MMETSDRGLLDIERFDKEPSRPLLHGLIEGLDLEQFKAASTLDKIPTALEIIGGEAVSPRMAASLVEIKESLKAWPQLASGVVLGGATSTDACRRIFLGELNESGRYYVDLEKIIADGAGVVVQPSPLGRTVSVEARTEVVLPMVTRATSARVSREQIRSLVAHGVMAPSGGNAQPWKFEFDGQRLHCFLDRERSRVFLDYQYFAGYLSLGAVVENIQLAAEHQGLAMTVDPFPQAGQEAHVCTLSFELLEGRAPSAELFEQIAKRVTNRKAGTRGRLTQVDRAAMLTAAELRHGRLALLDDEHRLGRLADLLGPVDRLRFTSRTMHGEMMNEVRWTPHEVELTRDGLDVATLELTPVDLAGLRLASLGAMELVGKLSGGRALEKPARRSVAGATALGLLSIDGGRSPRTMFEGGRALQRVWLTAGARGYSIQPMTVMVCLFWRLLDGATGLNPREISLLKELRPQFVELFDVPRHHGEVMLFRLARADAPTAHSLRRPVEQLLSMAR